MSKFCEKCNHTGLIPFVKDGRLIADTWIDCECKQPEVEHYESISPEDYDYPLSDTFRGNSFQFCGVPDPASPLIERVIEERIIERETVSVGPSMEYQQQGRMILHLQKKIEEHLTVPDKKRVYKKYD